MINQHSNPLLMPVESPELFSFPNLWWESCHQNFGNTQISKNKSRDCRDHNVSFAQCYRMNLDI